VSAILAWNHLIPSDCFKTIGDAIGLHLFHLLLEIYYCVPTTKYTRIVESVQHKSFDKIRHTADGNVWDTIDFLADYGTMVSV
jgi:hypothetical protein